MEKITKSSKSILIDPNEPLILPDGTALVGRIEWFLYALCCLDYQNLPTPMSRIEEFANALITGEIPNIEPQSRAEQFFLAILDGNVSNLPQPQSRSEILLDKLARGEFDLSDVEPIQSHYELLLAYLIKNGGIGNIDYVLYEFSEAMKTMYNTVEKPFKSLELSGNTLVNCVLEDTENDDYTSFDEDYSGTSFTINGTSEGAIKSAILSGNTLVNLAPNDTFEGSATNRGQEFTLTQPIQPNKQYILLVNITKDDTVGGWHCRFADDSGNYPTFQSSIKGVGLKKVVFTTSIALSKFFPYFEIEDCEQGRYITMENVMLLEYQQGMENWDIPYFEGMQSVKLPVLTTTGKNLFDINNVIQQDGIIVNGNSILISENRDYPDNIIYTFENAPTESVLSFELSSNDVQNPGGALASVWYEDGTNIWITVERHRYENTKKVTGIKIHNWCKGTHIFSNIQLEKGTTATSYEPYKSNILTTTSKNLFNMNRPYDVITDSQATVVQDTNKITVSSAESGTYVSANFILDKDFFAGKTVTGSCLYESDEKDIGTVQIHYQDGNGDHHYQWIRTPKTFTFPNNFIGDVMLCVCVNNTDTPQSNTVTVKNIQLELGSTATSYEPYSEGVTLRGIGDVKDELDCKTGGVTERISEIVFDGSDDEGWGVASEGDTINGFSIWKNIDNAHHKGLVCDKLSYFDYSDLKNDKTQFISCINQTRVIVVNIKGLTSVDEVKQWLSENPITVQYQLATESIKTVDLNVVDQNNTKIDKMHVFNEVTHVNASSDELTPTVNIGKSVSYPTIIKPNTKYTVDLKRNDKPLTVNLGGTEVTFASGETRKTITTPSTLTNDKLSYYGIGAKCNEIMLIEGEVEGNVDYFTGMQSVKNYQTLTNTVTRVINNYSWTTSDNVTFTSDGSSFSFINYECALKPNTKYLISFEYDYVSSSNLGIQVGFRTDLGAWDNYITTNVKGTYKGTMVTGTASNNLSVIIMNGQTLTSASFGKLMVIEYQDGMENWSLPYFEGMQSVKMPILCTTGKNLLNPSWKKEYGKFYPFKLKKGTTLTLSTKDSVPSLGGNILFTDVKGNEKWFSIDAGATKNTITLYEDVYQVNNVLSGTIEYQLEIGSVATAYEPYKSSILSCNDDVTLRGIGDVQDTLDCLTGGVVERIGEMVLDGSDDESWVKNSSTDTTALYSVSLNNLNRKIGVDNVFCDRFITKNTYNNDTNKESIFASSSNQSIYIRINKNKLTSESVDGIKTWLSQNPITIQYQLATPTIKTVDLNVVDQDGNTIPKIKSHDGVTHLEVTVPKQSLLPNVSAEVATDNSKDMSSLTTKHQEISETQSTIQDNIQSQSDEIDTAMMATTEIFESILE